VSVEETVRAAKSPIEGLILLAREVDKLRDEIAQVAELEAKPADPWSAWGDPDSGQPVPPMGVELAIGEEHTTITFPQASDAKLATRANFAAKFSENQDFMAKDVFEETYAKGGPLWLWYGNRDYLMTLPEDWRQAMVADVAEDCDPELAHKFSRDVLKRTDAGDPSVTMTAVLGYTPNLD
jgi:hypothetical protein